MIRSMGTKKIAFEVVSKKIIENDNVLPSFSFSFCNPNPIKSI